MSNRPRSPDAAPSPHLTFTGKQQRRPDVDPTTEKILKGGRKAKAQASEPAGKKVDPTPIPGGLTFGPMATQYAGGGALPGGKTRKANASPSGGGGGAWADPTIYKRKTEVEARTGIMFESLQAFRDSEHWVPPPADSFSQAGVNARREGEASGFPGGMTYGAQSTYDGSERTAVTGTSIFDPVLTELAYRWYCPPGGLVLDPFAGGSVRGIVASWLGRRYLGVDLSARQIEANRAQAERICAGKPMPEWREGDARDLGAIAGDAEADFLMACPPYWNLERYSDDERDLSTLDDFAEFNAAYAAIIAAACGLLKPDRFACFVVGDVRDKRGFYAGFPAATIAAFQAAGVGLYNEAVLVTACGSLPVRVRGQFESSRKLGKTHQNVLIFCKGDPRAATAAVGPVEFGDIETATEEHSPRTDEVQTVGATASARVPAPGGEIGGEV